MYTYLDCVILYSASRVAKCIAKTVLLLRELFSRDLVAIVPLGHGTASYNMISLHELIYICVCVCVVTRCGYCFPNSNCELCCRDWSCLAFNLRLSCRTIRPFSAFIYAFT